MSKQVLVSPESYLPGALLPAGSKVRRSRLKQFLSWQKEQDLPWWKPDLAGWRDSLLDAGLAPSSVRSYLSTVRGAYRRVLHDNEARQWILSRIPGMRSDGTPRIEADVQAVLNETLARLQNAVHPVNAEVGMVEKRDVADSEHLRLTRAQAEALLDAPDVGMLRGLRDVAIIAMLLCTGIREGELCALEVNDLRQSLGGELALLVREGKGSVQRLVPYGDLDWCLRLVDAWLAEAEITDGAVFRGLYKGGGKLRPGGLAEFSVQRILASYPITVGGRETVVRPHDCRRTYARQLYEAGADMVAIQQNLGHASMETTRGYIGRLDASQRRGRAIYLFDFSKLYRQQSLGLK